MFRWGVLSTAKIAREHLLPAIANASNSVLHGVASRDLKAAQAVADQYNAPLAFGDYQALLDHPDIDGVYIPLPGSMHVEWSERAAKAGKHVLCEKPIAASADEISKLIALRDETGLLISEGFMVTYHPQWAYVRDVLASGAIGSLKQVQAAFSYYNDDATNLRNRPELGGGAIPDIGVYPTVTTRFATGQEPVRARAEIEYSNDFGTDIHAQIALEFPDFKMHFYVSTQMATHQDIAFHGDKGRVQVAAPFNAELFEYPAVSVFDEASQTAARRKFGNIRQYLLQVEAFVRAVNDRNAPHFTLEDSRKNQAVLDAIYASDKAGDWVDVAAF